MLLDEKGGGCRGKNGMRELVCVREMYSRTLDTQAFFVFSFFLHTQSHSAGAEAGDCL